MDHRHPKHTTMLMGIETEAHSYLVEEVESFDVGLFSVEELFGDVQEPLSL